jgi:hypothetical protein
MVRTVSTAAFPVEDITATNHPSRHFAIDGAANDMQASTDEAFQPPLRQSRVKRACRTRKNGNWTDEQLSSAIAAHDSGMSMKKASEQFNIPYSSFREHCYGLRRSREKGGKRNSLYTGGAAIV